MVGRDHEVVVVRDARSALTLLASDPDFDVILSDVMLPGMSGTDLMAELSARPGELNQRMVFLTGGAFSPEARAALATTTVPVIEKPFDRAQLRMVIDGLVLRRRSS